MNYSVKAPVCTYLFFTLSVCFFLACQSSSDSKQDTEQTTQQKTLGNDENKIPLYILYFDSAKFRQNLILNSPEPTKRIVFTFAAKKKYDALTMGVWPAKNKVKFLSDTPKVILLIGSKLDTLVTGDTLLLVDQQARRQRMERLLDNSRGKLVVFEPTIVKKGRYSILSYYVYLADDSNKASMLPNRSFRLDPCPPADVEDDNSPGP